MFLQKKHSKKIFEYYGLCFDNPCPKNYYAELEKIKWNLKRRTRKARSLRRDELSMKQKKKLKMLKTVEIAMEALKRGVMQFEYKSDVRYYTDENYNPNNLEFEYGSTNHPDFKVPKVDIAKIHETDAQTYQNWCDLAGQKNVNLEYRLDWAVVDTYEKALGSSLVKYEERHYFMSLVMTVTLPSEI
eukprot:GEZU01010736.1.p1 GENE.GEZU01010736.1~~GEZU01010736.1.p1  ORF type:complete len:187 (+),score=46.47 GEZU01010736.1:161-721(+)